MKKNNSVRCTCGIIHAAKDWRNAWRHALADRRVIGLRDEAGSQIELRSYPDRESLWAAVEKFTAQNIDAYVVEA